MEEEDDNIASTPPFAPDDPPPVWDEMRDTSDFKEVAVPHTPLNYRCFYDWPPQPDYAYVWKSEPPDNNPVAEQILEDDAFELYGELCRDNITVQGSMGWGN